MYQAVSHALVSYTEERCVVLGAECVVGCMSYFNISTGEGRTQRCHITNSGKTKWDSSEKYFADCIFSLWLVRGREVPHNAHRDFTACAH